MRLPSHRDQVESGERLAEDSHADGVWPLLRRMVLGTMRRLPFDPSTIPVAAPEVIS